MNKGFYNRGDNTPVEWVNEESMREKNIGYSDEATFDSFSCYALLIAELSDPHRESRRRF